MLKLPSSLSLFVELTGIHRLSLLSAFAGSSELRGVVSEHPQMKAQVNLSNCMGIVWLFSTDFLMEVVGGGEAHLNS